VGAKGTMKKVIEATEDAPIYRKVPHDDGWATQLWFIVCNEGWRESIVCERMFDWAADWLLDILDRRPFSKRRNGEL